MQIYKIFKDEIVEAELKKLNDECRKLEKSLKECQELYCKKYKEYSETKIRKTFKDGLCSNCYNKLSKEEIEYEMVYCGDCLETDSCLDCHIIDI